jgi:hypothetical protein
MSDKTKVWLLSGMAVALAIGVIWQLIIRKDEFFQSSETPANVRPPGNSDNKRSTSAGRAANPGAGSTVTKTTTPNSYSGLEDDAGSPPAKPNAGIEGDATPPPAKRKIALKNAVPAPIPQRPAAERSAAPPQSKAGTSPPQQPTAAVSSNTPPAGAAAAPKISDSPQPQLSTPQGPLTAEMMLEKAQAALARGDYVSTPDNNALYWARRARRMNPQYQPAIQIEETIFFEVTQLIQSDRKAGRYDSALMRLDMMQKLYPNRTQLTQLRSTIQQEKSRGQGTNPR